MNLGFSMDRTKALEFSNDLMADIIADEHQKIYSKMDPQFAQMYSAEEVPATLNKIQDAFGKPLETEYKSEEAGYWQYPDGAKKPMRKFWYSTKTSKAEKGTYFFQISVVPNGDKLACASFSLLTFPLGLPENLK